MKISLAQIIRKGQKRSQMIIAFVGSVVGLFLLIASIQFYIDYNEIMTGGDNALKNGFMIEKKVSATNTISGKKVSFTKEEIDKVKGLGFVDDLAPVKTSNFKVELSGGPGVKKLLKGNDFSLLFFFQSLPDRFVEQSDDKFKWVEGDSLIPIIVPSDYLNLFNNGFASAQGVSQLSGDLLSAIDLNVKIEGNNRKDVFRARIVNFNPIINSILVPESFMDWAAKTYGEQNQPEEYSRLFVIANSKKHHEFTDLIEKEGYVVNQSKLETAKYKQEIQIILSVVLFIGGIILLQAALNFILYSQLTIFKNEYEIGVLTNIGYDYKTISKTYIFHFAKIFVLITLVAFLLAIVGKLVLNDFAAERKIELTGSLAPVTYVIGLVFFIVYVTVNSLSINRTIKEIAKRN